MLKRLSLVAALATASMAGATHAAPLDWASDPSCSLVGQYVMPCGRQYTESRAGIVWASAQECTYTGQYVMACARARVDPAAVTGLHESCRLSGQYVMPCARRTDGR